MVWRSGSTVQRRIVGVDLIDTEVCKTTLIWLKRNNGSNCSVFGARRPLPGWLAGPAHHVMKQLGWTVGSHVWFGTYWTPEHHQNAINPKDQYCLSVKGSVHTNFKKNSSCGFSRSFGFKCPGFEISEIMRIHMEILTFVRYIQYLLWTSPLSILHFIHMLSRCHQLSVVYYKIYTLITIIWKVIAIIIKLWGCDRERN